MNSDFLIFFAGALFCILLAGFTVFQNWRDFVTRIFALGMLLLAADSTLSALSLLTDSSLTALRLQHLRLVAASFLPGIWLVFSLSFARSNYKIFLQAWKWPILCVFILPVILPTLFGGKFFQQPVLFLSSQEIWILRLGWSGYLYHILSLLGAVLVLINLEKTLRTSVGHIRWQIKFLILGVGSLFGVRIFTDSQAILYHTLDTSLLAVNGIALLVACPLMLFSLYRSKTLAVRFYLSHSFLYASFTLLFIGLYLIAVALIAKAAPFLTGRHTVPSQAFLIFLLFLGLAIFLFSDRLRRRLKRFVSLHFSRPFYDYRKEWQTFTHTTGSVLDLAPLCQAIAGMVSRTLDVLSVSLWVTDESEKRLVLLGSTALSKSDIPDAESAEEDLFQLAKAIREEKIPLDYDFRRDKQKILENLQNRDLCSSLKIDYALPLVSGDQLAGLMTVGERIGHDPLSLEDLELLSTLADQAAGSLLTVKLSEKMRKVKEEEAFRTMSAFFIHDLKNLASKLSLTMENLPVHFDNEEFRNDTIQMMSQSVDKIKIMCNRLSSLGEKIDLQKTQVDLNELVKTTLAGFNGALKARVTQDLKPLPNLDADPEQLQKVLVNLLLNANDAVASSSDPLIQVSSGLHGNWIEICFSDNGQGMSREFIEKSLFHPFKTTKKSGMGIGLFHSKMIVEAHRGRLEAESIEGEKTTFRILLPVTGL
ncbi:XrtA/PEP-CTERM system histidine kinase PrsK [Syntrophus buswellii]|uniref:XrtA/PEP-CTERM system histidine kinase PrsK n=1 Tax=Syntrophus buswellii TaxID=43774 RepID=UPI0038D38A8B